MLEIKNISHWFDGLQVLSDVSFSVNENEIVALMGPSGCGKSTLLEITAGFFEPKYGHVKIYGDKISFVFQNDRLLPWKDIWDNIAVVKDMYDKEQIQQLIDEVGLNGFEHYKPDRLSGGMRKRVGIARAFYYDAPILLMDEPFSGLDYCLRQDMLKCLRSILVRRKKASCL